MTTETKTFAPGYEREEHGWIVFPRDTRLRKELAGQTIGDKLSIHPAKMNMHLCQEIIRYNTQPGELIVDPFGGIGTTLIGALMGRNVALLEIEDAYADLCRETINYYQFNNTTIENTQGSMVVFQGDNRQLLPVPCNHIITSPPYGNDLFKESHALTQVTEAVTTYGNSSLNIGRLNTFHYNQAMKKLYQKMADSLKPGGTITITHRDRMRGEERILFGLELMRSLQNCGLKLHWWEKWKAPGSIQSRINEKNGVESVLDEDIICFRKPE